MVLLDSDGISRVPPYSGSTARYQSVVYGTLTPYGWPSQTIPLQLVVIIGVLQPRNKLRFGLFPFRSPLLRESIFLSLPPGTKMFQFPGSTFLADNDSCRWVPPFGNLWINAYLQLPRAYRR